jgi:hypothetical protein
MLPLTNTHDLLLNSKDDLVENNTISEDDNETDRTDINTFIKEILATKGDVEET